MYYYLTILIPVRHKPLDICTNPNIKSRIIDIQIGLIIYLLTN
jgi:hypothetical protein